MQQAPLLHYRHFLHVRDSLSVGYVRGEVSNVAVAFVARSAYEIVAFSVHSIASAEDVFRPVCFLIAKYNPALHRRGDLNAGEAQDGWGKINEVYELIADAAGHDCLWCADDERDTEAGIIRPAFASWQAAAMVAPEENDGTFGEAVSIEFVKDIAELFVHCSDVVVVLCEVAPDDRSIGVVRRDFDLCGIVDSFFDVPAFAFMRNGEVDDGEKRCIFGAVFVAPVAPFGVPCGERRGKLVIGLSVI